MTGPVFVDTNAFVYRYDTQEPAKQSRADVWFTFILRRPLCSGTHRLGSRGGRFGTRFPVRRLSSTSPLPGLGVTFPPARN